MNRKTFVTLDEAIEYLYSEEIESDIVALPPEVDELTDEEDINDEDLAVPFVSDFAGMTEVDCPSDSDSDFDVPLAVLAKQGPSTLYQGSFPSHDEVGEPAPKRKAPDKPNWQEVDPQYEAWDNSNTPDEKFASMLPTLSDAGMIDIFEHFFSQEVYQLIVDETIRYATAQKNRATFTVAVEDIKIFIGFLIFSGYHRLPSERDYWSDSEDLGIQLVKSAMSRNQYLELKALLHLQDNSKASQNKNDRAFKIRSLVDIINKNFRKWGIFQKHLSIDEMMVKYYGHHGLKQFIRGKPIRFGYKLWAMCGDSGYCFNFSLYCGKETTQGSGPLGTRVVTNMLSVVDDPYGYTVHFDNYFTSYGLLTILKEKGFRASGTIRDNRTEKCPLKPVKEIEKSKRGVFDYRFDQNSKIAMVRWNDNRCVTVGSNFDAIEPTCSVRRWDKDKKERALVPQPQMISNYNKYMGGVDHHDWLLEKHSIAIRGKKWYWCLVTRVVDMAIVNSFILYNLLHPKNTTSIKEFRRNIAVTYLKMGYGRRVQRGRPLSLPSTSRTKIFDDVRFDGYNHILERRENQRRCQLASCTGKPRTFCKKCNVTLCLPCFPKFHDKTYKN